LKLLDYKTCDYLNGIGTRFSIWLSGCDHQCKGCFAQNTWSYNGLTITPEELLKTTEKAMIGSNIKYDGITILGGDPFYKRNLDGLYEFLKLFKSKHTLSVWVYTGYTYEECLLNEKIKRILPYIDVLVDGKFEIEHKTTKPFIGSSNQRILNLKDGVIVL